MNSDENNTSTNNNPVVSETNEQEPAQHLVEQSTTETPADSSDAIAPAADDAQAKESSTEKTDSDSKKNVSTNFQQTQSFSLTPKRV